ncbi:hypothetical protein EDD11_005244 [Mortierella claussenii]|nr:hypothetical protein EDD11_005244 [Mortierella claussenii]
MHRRVQDLLHNTSIQRIRTWFHDTIEPFALEQWRNISYFNHLNRLGATAASGDGHALEHQGSAATSVEECPICFRSRVIMKRIYPCDHFVCWKCEQQLDRAGNISCPICRGLRFYASYISVVDLFKTTIGLLPRDYTHPHLASLLEPTATDLDRDAMDDAEEIEHELTDRYIWEQSESFLEHVHVSAKRYPVTQYFQLNAAHDHCFKPSREHLLPEYNDQSVFDPPTSGLVLPPHRLYIALIHVCLDMLTLPDPATFQYCQLKPAPFKREVMLIELVALFLIPTDEFSPRGPGRIYNTAAWIEHGQYILARIYYFLKAKVCRFKWELDGEDILPLAGHQQHQQNHEQALGPSSIGVPSAPLPRSILYLGTERWMWVVRSLTVLLTWLQAARTNPSMAMPEVCMQPKESLLGKHELQQDEDENPRPVKRQRMWRRAQ